MADKFDQDGKWNFAFIPAFADCIARVASVWARLEYDINVTIWALADTRPALGACITSQIFTLQARLDALLALAKIRQLDSSIIKQINKFADDSRGGQEIRNRIIHDMWLQDRLNPGHMGHLRITAAKKLEFVIASVPLFELTADLEKLEDLCARFSAIRKSIEVALPLLPDKPSAGNRFTSTARLRQRLSVPLIHSFIEWPPVCRRSGAVARRPTPTHNTAYAVGPTKFGPGSAITSLILVSPISASPLAPA
jgi:hypothetical protein